MKTNSEWAGIHRAGGVAALVLAIFLPIQVVVLVISPPPSTVPAWFALFQRSWLLGLLDMDLLLILDQVLLILVFVALYFALRGVGRSAIVLGTVAGVIGAVTYFISSGAFEMLSLSNAYAHASDAATKAVMLSAGQTVMATWQGTAFNLAYVLEAVAFFLLAYVMLRTRALGRFIAWTTLALAVLSILPPTAGLPGMILALASLVPLEIFAVAVSVKLMKIAKVPEGGSLPAPSLA